VKVKDIYSKIKHFCDDHDLLATPSKVVAALSGGADSVFLVRYLTDQGYPVEAAHCNFHLRGEESDRDEAFVSTFCETLHIPLHVKHFDTESYARAQGISIEMAARDLRYAWFEQLREQLQAQVIAVAHHRDDNIESLLLNLTRGTGLRGMRGMQPVNGNVVRPLLCISRADIEEGLKELQQTYVDDSTNFQTLYSRNRIRLDVLPLLHTINSGAEENIATTIDNLNEAYKVYEQAMKEAVGRCCQRKDDTLIVDIDQLNQCVSPLSVLHYLLTDKGFNRSQLVQLLACQTTGRQFESGSHMAVVHANHIIVCPKGDERETYPIVLEEWPKIVQEEKRREDCNIDRDPQKAFIDADKIKGRLMVRPVRQGDTFHPFGMKGKKLVSDYLTDLKLNIIEKKRQLVVCDGETIVWIVGRRLSDSYKIDSQTRRVLCLHYHPEEQ